jgi:serine/threonine protein phosphatase PrpC
VSTAKQALRRIVEADPAVGSMGTTLTAMLWAGGAAAICHIGDSRAYLLRDGDLYQITRDHTFVQALIDQGRIRPEEAATHPQRSLLLRALDGRSDADPDLSMLTAQVADRYLLCSDGLPVAASDEQILQALSQGIEPSDTVMRLIDLAIAGGAPDNVTCIVADVIDTNTSGAMPTKAPVLAGAAVHGGPEADNMTRPFTRPAFDGESVATELGTIPAAASRTRETVPVQPRPAQAGPAQAGPPLAGPAQAGPAQARPAQARPGPSPRASATSGRHAAPEADDAVPAPRRGRRLPLMPSILALFVLLIGGALVLGYQYVHSQYYVGVSKGKVVIFQGLDQNLLGMSLSSVYQSTQIPFSGVQQADAQAINQATSSSLAQARRFLSNVSKDYQACQTAYAAVSQWEAHKPKPFKRTIKVHGKPRTITVTPHYRPKPPIPSGCPKQPASGT